MKNIIFIPARSGSKGIPNKNIVKINGKSLISYTYAFAEYIKKNYKNFDILISTDSSDILKKLKNKNYNFDYLRPKSLAGDKSNVADAILDGINWYENNIDNINNILMLQPTSPYRIKNDFNSFYKNFINKKKQALVSVIRVKEHPSECIEIKNNKWSYVVEPKKNYYGRQSYGQNYYFIDGSFYMASKFFLLKHKSFLVKNITKFHTLSHNWPMDIDSFEDLKLLKSSNMLK